MHLSIFGVGLIHFFDVQIVDFVAMLANQVEFFPEDGLMRVLPQKLNVLLLHVLLNCSPDARVFECSIQLGRAPLTLEELNELGLHEHEHLADLALATLGGQFNLVALSGGANVLRCVLGDLLRHDLIVEGEWVFVRLAVIKFVAIRLDDVGLAWRGRVVETVLLGASAVPHGVLMLPCGVLLRDQALGWRNVAFQVIRRLVEVTKHLVEVVVLLSGRSVVRDAGLKDAVEFGFELGGGGFKLRVAEFVS